MNNQNDNRIKIRLEIDIPTSCGQPEVSVTQSLPDKEKTESVPNEPKASKLTSSFFRSIIVPSGPAWAEWDAGAATGRVCASGIAIDLSGNVADNVVLKIVPGQPGLHPYPPPSGPVIPVNQISGRWEAYPDGVTDHPNQTPHAIYCWADFGNGYVGFGSSPFTPVWTSYPHCNYPSLAAVTTSSNPSLDVLPKTWNLETMGFSGKDVELFNGYWEMTLRSGNEDKILYCNGGNKITVPQIQMQSTLPNAKDWTVSFKIGGSHIIYRLAENDFDPQSANIFRNATTVGVNEFSGIPAAVKVVPM